LIDLDSAFRRFRSLHNRKSKLSRVTIYSDNIIRMWSIRLVLLDILRVIVCVGNLLLRGRSRYEGLLESEPFNYFLLVLYNVLSWLIVVLPLSGGWDSRPDGLLFFPALFVINVARS